MCIGADMPEVKPPPPPPPPTSTPRIQATETALQTQVTATGQKVRRGGIGSLRIDKAAAGNGLNIPT